MVADLSAPQVGERVLIMLDESGEWYWSGTVVAIDTSSGAINTHQVKLDGGGDIDWFKADDLSEEYLD